MKIVATILTVLLASTTVSAQVQINQRSGGKGAMLVGTDNITTHIFKGQQVYEAPFHLKLPSGEIYLSSDVAIFDCKDQKGNLYLLGAASEQITGEAITWSRKGRTDFDRVAIAICSKVGWR